jgi:hypothetical protein
MAAFRDKKSLAGMFDLSGGPEFMAKGCPEGRVFP